MKVQPCCLTCLKSLADKTIALSAGDETLAADCHHLIDTLWDPNATPPAISNVLLKHIRQQTGVADPYFQAKVREYEEARRAFAELRDRFSLSLEDTLRLSALGNSMDFFIDSQYDLNNFIFSSDMAKIEEAIYIKEKDTLILGDNMGDFIFDMPFVEYLEGLGKNVYYAVRERPVQNDLSMEDVRRFGFDDAFHRIISIGTGKVGMKKEDLTGTVKALWEGNGAVIAKGMGNFETISEFHNERSVVYIMKVKCQAVAQAVKQDLGTYIASTGGE